MSPSTSHPSALWTVASLKYWEQLLGGSYLCLRLPPAIECSALRTCCSDALSCPLLSVHHGTHQCTSGLILKDSTLCWNTALSCYSHQSFYTCGKPSAQCFVQYFSAVLVKHPESHCQGQLVTNCDLTRPLVLVTPSWCVVHVWGAVVA
jgi:hypothetical protein